MRRRDWLQGAGAWGVVPAWPGAAAASPARWRLAGPPLPTPEARLFHLALLRLALRKAGAPDGVELLPAQSWMRQARELQEGRLDVAPLPAVTPDPYGDLGLLRVDVPLRLGLSGVRLLMVLSSRVAEFEALTDAEQLTRHFTLGWGSEWDDVATLQQLGVRLKTAPTLAQLYEMLRLGEVDCLCRSVHEAESERHLHAHWPEPARPVPGVLLSQPIDDCFFVSPQRPALRRTLADGLDAAGRDGSHLALLKQHHGEALALWGGARVLPLPKYPVAAGLPLARFEGWRAMLPARPAPVRASPRNALTLRVAAGQTPDDPRFRYATELLQLALQSVGIKLEVVPVGGLTQPRQAMELAHGALDVGQLPAVGTVREGQALPVALPIRRGLLGVRLLVARRERAEAIAAVPDLAALQKRFRFGHGADWGDLELMRRSGFQVTTSDHYQALFRMLEAGRFDCLSRAVSEVWDELDAPSLAGSGNLVVVPRIALFYPLDDFFWVSPARPELVDWIQAGLLRARGDGGFDRLYRRYYGPSLARAQLKRRTVFRLPFAPLPAGSPPHWFDALEHDVARAPTNRMPMSSRSTG